MSVVTDLVSLGDELLEDARVSSAGRAARMVVSEPGLRVSLLALRAGAELAEHDAPAAASLHVLRGELVLVTGALERRTLSAGEIVAIPHARHSVEASQDVTFLLTVSLHG